jgi:hypothetical protein
MKTLPVALPTAIFARLVMSVYNDGTVFFCMGAKRGVRPEGVEGQWLGELWFCDGSVKTLEKDTQ